MMDNDRAFVPPRENQHYLFYLDNTIVLEPGQTLKLGRERSCDIVLDERTVSLVHAEIQRDGDHVRIIDKGSSSGVQVNDQMVTDHQLQNEDRITIGPFIMVYRSQDQQSGLEENPAAEENPLEETMILEKKIASILKNIQDDGLRNQLYELKHLINQSRKKLSTMANVDRLTKLYNRRFFDDFLPREIERARRYGEAFSLLMLDVDLFKKVNDKHGHQKGDQVLGEIASLISSNIRMSDIATRYGGEEIAVILPLTQMKDAVSCAEKLRAVIERESLSKTGLGMTVSIGVASYNRGETGSQDLISRADLALYRAKQNGRNCVAFNSVDSSASPP